MASYRELYSEHLEELMQKGGSPSEMEEAVDEYNHFGPLNGETSEGFQHWGLKTPFVCTTCNAEFTRESVPAALDEVTCNTCVTSPKLEVEEVNTNADQDRVGENPRGDDDGGSP